MTPIPFSTVTDQITLPKTVKRDIVLERKKGAVLKPPRFTPYLNGLSRVYCQRERPKQHQQRSVCVIHSPA